ncbi:helicase associated domain-containing protein [Streptomyces candidus]|uniref:Helicase-associated domain-containing protein n=1 Tax=Streptomyces candidus TaxID=67283 RepID=A0A7X0LUK2_9ACTN|nr:hypothetical protein [Streptomyces candidus]GHH57736.1 hypothetical protein GCM10018773_65500 [Streptomyces candidus]
MIYAREHGDLKVPFTYRVPAADDQEAEDTVWPASLAGFPLGQWTADARRLYARGDMDADRVAQLEKFGMIWSHYDIAWEEGLSAARGWAAEHGHLLAPVDATFQGAAVGIWLKNARAAARKAQEIERRCAEGLPVGSSAGAMPDERREQLEDIDASWCPAWPVSWQRCFHLVRTHLNTGAALPTTPGEILRQGEDLGRWVQTVRHGWDQLTSVQQWMCEQVLGITPASEDEKPPRPRTQADKWAAHLAAARQFYAREGHLNVPRKHVETVLTHDGREDQYRLGAWINNQRSRAIGLTPERMEQLSRSACGGRNRHRRHRAGRRSGCSAVHVSFRKPDLLSGWTCPLRSLPGSQFGPPWPGRRRAGHPRRPLPRAASRSSRTVPSPPTPARTDPPRTVR